jgi:seryl-tRNA synthetase
MLDIKFIKEHPDLIKEAARKKHLDFDVSALLEVEEKRAAAQREFEALRTEQNKLGEEIPKATDPVVRAKLIEDLKPLKEKVQAAEEAMKAVMKEWQALMLQVPNIPDMTVPEGEDDTGNVETKVWGDKPVFSFTPKDHIALMESLGMAGNSGQQQERGGHPRR